MAARPMFVDGGALVRERGGWCDLGLRWWCLGGKGEEEGYG